MSSTSSSADYKVPMLCLCLGVGAYYSLQAFVPEEVKARARKAARQVIPWKRKQERLQFEASRGDGLQSIFKNTNAALLMEDNNVEGMNRIPSMWDLEGDDENDLNEVQQIAFDALLSCGVIDSSIGLGVLKATLRSATIVHKSQGDYIFRHDDKYRNDILVLKSGACEVIYHKGHSNESSVVVSQITGRRLLASVVDIVSWIIGHSSFECLMSVRCTEDCEVIAIPSPRKTAGSLKSPLYICSYANLVRSLLIRFSRTTVTSSLFYLGLAEHM